MKTKLNIIDASQGLQSICLSYFLIVLTPNSRFVKILFITDLLVILGELNYKTIKAAS